MENGISKSAERELCIHIIYEYLLTPDANEEVIHETLKQETFSRLEDEDQLYKAYPSEDQVAYITKFCEGVLSHIEEYNTIISKYAVGWKISRISKILLSILYVCIYEIENVESVPYEVSINEAVEFAKRYDSKESSAFINGILSSYIKERGNNE